MMRSHLSWNHVCYNTLISKRSSLNCYCGQRIPRHGGHLCYIGLLCFLFGLLLVNGQCPPNGVCNQANVSNRFQRRFMLKDGINVMDTLLKRLLTRSNLIKNLLTNNHDSSEKGISNYNNQPKLKKNVLDYIPTETTRVKYIIHSPHGNDVKVITMRPSRKLIMYPAQHTVSTSSFQSGMNRYQVPITMKHQQPQAMALKQNLMDNEKGINLKNSKQSQMATPSSSSSTKKDTEQNKDTKLTKNKDDKNDWKPLLNKNHSNQINKLENFNKSKKSYQAASKLHTSIIDSGLLTYETMPKSMQAKQTSEQQSNEHTYEVTEENGEPEVFHVPMTNEYLSYPSIMPSDEDGGGEFTILEAENSDEKIKTLKPIQTHYIYNYLPQTENDDFSPTITTPTKSMATILNLPATKIEVDRHTNNNDNDIIKPHIKSHTITTNTADIGKDMPNYPLHFLKKLRNASNQKNGNSSGNSNIDIGLEMASLRDDNWLPSHNLNYLGKSLIKAKTKTTKDKITGPTTIKPPSLVQQSTSASSSSLSETTSRAISPTIKKPSTNPLDLINSNSQRFRTLSQRWPPAKGQQESLPSETISATNVHHQSHHHQHQHQHQEDIDDGIGESHMSPHKTTATTTALRFKSTIENGANNGNHERHLIKSENSLSRNIKHTKRSRGNIKFGDKIVAEQRNDNIEDIDVIDNYNLNDNNDKQDQDQDHHQKKKKKVLSENFINNNNYSSSEIITTSTSLLTSTLHTPEIILAKLST